MSAVRRGDRRTNRNNLSSPYARPTAKSNKVQPSKKSGWSLSGLLNFFNPFGGGSNEPEEDDYHSEDDLTVTRRSPLVPIIRRQPSPPPPPLVQPPPQLTIRQSAVNGEAAESTLASQSSRHQPSFSFSSPTPAGSNSSLVKHLEPVTRFLVEKAGQPLNEFEAAGIVDYIQRNVQGPSSSNLDRPEPFRFSTSPSRSLSPNLGQTNADVEPPRKTLSRNPNGAYRWQGGGSSRPRNRYQSPGFAPRTQHRMKLSPPKTPLTTDTKRRRVGDEAEASTPQKAPGPSTSTVSFPISGPESPMASSQHVGSAAAVPNGTAPVLPTFGTVPPVTPKANGIQPRIRTVALPVKSTTPAIPSPLRQAWKDSDSSPQGSPSSRPTRAADFMTELIKGVTPTKKPDVSNPYQTASPVKPPAPARKPVLKRPKSAPKPVEEPMEKESETSAQAIIEATVPKGTKRSRPPKVEQPPRGEDMMDGEPSPPALNGSAQPVRFPGVVRTSVETISIVEEEESPSKRRKIPTPQPLVKIQEMQEVDETSPSMEVTRPSEIIEPIDDVAGINGKVTPPAAAATTMSPPAQKSLFGGVKATAPKEPSKLRYSYQADKVEVKGPEAAASPPRFPSFFVPPIPASFPLVPAAFPANAKLSPKEEALAMDVDRLPTYTFTLPATTSYPAGPSTSAARKAVLAMSVTALPTYEFKPVTAPVRAMNGFNWTAAGLKAPTAVGQGWKCAVCDLDNPASAKEKCTICDAPRTAPANTLSSSSTPKPTPSPPAPTPSAPIAPAKAFDWAAAGMAPQPKPANGTWSCSVCMLYNPTSATDKCTFCDAPR